jgi:arylsulfatase A-like enzyme
MSRLAVLLALAVPCLLPTTTPAAAPARKWNILFLFSDDQRADTVAALGNKHIQTPNLDKLVHQGTAFTRAYCMGSAKGGAVCVPSRAMLMTGRTLFRVKENLQGQVTWPEEFARAGYVTFMTGKWHNGGPSLVRAFGQIHSAFLGGMGNPYTLPIDDLDEKHKLTASHPTPKHSVEQFADSAIAFLRKQKGDRPFLAYVAFNAPHDPRLAPKKYHEFYNTHQPPVPPNFLPQHPFNNGDLIGRDEKLAPWPRTPALVRQHLADYYAAITFLDEQVGRILQALKDSGQYENTIIIFTSDHGLAIGSHGLFGKQNLYECSMHVPLLVVGPGLPQGRRSDAFVYLLDLFPTLGALTGVPAPPGSEGLNLAPVLRGQERGVRDSLLLAYRNVQRSVLDDRYQLIVYPQINKTQLFDLKADPDELKDLAADPAHAGDVRRLTELLRQGQGRAGDDQPLSTPNPQPLEFDFSKVRRP